MERWGPIVATATAATVREVTAAARAARLAGADRVEVRLDLLAPGEDVAAALALATEMPLLVSGHRNAPTEAELAFFRRAQALGAWVDVPFAESFPEGRYGLDPSRLILSWHGEPASRAGLASILDRMASRQAAGYKLVPEARDLPDALEVLRFLETSAAQGAVCAFASGGPGSISRVLALAWGSEAVYAAAPGCAPAAPGQLTLEDMDLVYRVRDCRKGEPLYALAGWPLTHSKTPTFFNPWLAAAGLPGRYVPAPCTAPSVLLDSGLPLAGVAVTVPHKTAALSFAVLASRLAQKARAANTLFRREGEWHAANTDVFGVRQALHGIPKSSRTLLLGSGGAAAAAAIALGARGPAAVSSRDDAKASRFAARFGLGHIPWDDRASASWDLLVNATPCGSEGDETPYPLDAPRSGWVMDMVVRPGSTPLMRAAAARGLEAIPGEAMLVPQAALQFRLWTGRRPPRQPHPPLA